MRSFITTTAGTIPLIANTSYLLFAKVILGAFFIMDTNQCMRNNFIWITCYLLFGRYNLLRSKRFKNWWLIQMVWLCTCIALWLNFLLSKYVYIRFKSDFRHLIMTFSQCTDYKILFFKRAFHYHANLMPTIWTAIRLSLLKNSWVPPKDSQLWIARNCLNA